MNLRIYRQKATTLKDGLTVYSGEDARPYVDEHLIMVADGLGGTGAIRHPSINRGVLDRDTIVDTFFNGVYDDLNDDVFANYVMDSFIELYELKEFYGKNPHALKKSSYFGSRLVLSILLKHFHNDEELKVEKLFENIYSLNDQEKDQFLNTLGVKIGNIIKEDLHKIASNANIIYESSIPRLKLLATTMCVTLFQENDDSIDAVYFIAGDSRPYYWNETDGLCQITEDLEGEDGGMTSCIYEGGDFSVCCKHFKFNKPCILFNASDGCFDSGKFKSQMAFEKLLLDSIVNNSSVEDIERALIKEYDTYGTHDDSSTLALHSFGFDSLAAISEACKHRLVFLQEKYIAQMEDLLSVDYVSEYQHVEKSFKDKLESCKERISTDKAIVKWCTEYVKAGRYRPYLEAVQSIDEEIVSEKNKIKKAKESITELVARNYGRFVKYTEQEGSWISKIKLANIDDCWEKCGHISKDYIFEIEKYRQDFERTVNVIETMLENIYEIGVPESFEDYSDLNFAVTQECEKTLEGLFAFFEDLKNKKVKLVKHLLDERDKYVKRNVALAEKNQEKFLTICQLVFDNRINLDDVDIITFDRKAIVDYIEDIEKSKKEVVRLNTEYKERALNDSVAEFLDTEYASIVLMVLKSKDVVIDPELKVEIATTAADYNNRAKELKEKSELQEKLFADYEVGYERIMRGELYGN